MVKLIKPKYKYIIKTDSVTPEYIQPLEVRIVNISAQLKLSNFIVAKSYESLVEKAKSMKRGVK